ncbi:hypothetical protein CDD82_4751 [Ophiocordyceps australis]|uniref:Laccase n=1 Tax=Ophiocordyceps australis TaxID=1399860 RepID=A0A2C5Z4R0_9HYPO|nr:hypothetical protein CDD82_4751 [Ophiocordyceps australis]
MGIGNSRLRRAVVNHSDTSKTRVLSQSKTNGKSLLGTVIAPLLPAFLSSNPLPNGFPWSQLSIDTNYYETVPFTGVIRSYNFTISRAVIQPDGYQRNVLLVNGAFPGPLIEANWGDTIQVTVHNAIEGPEEGVALHWHGFLQTGKPWEDGVPAVTQCPIAPGKSFTYSFEAELYGSSWYHSHYSSQYAGGLFGPMVIYGPRQEQYDIDLGPILLSDWYHDDYFDLVERIMKPGGDLFKSDNNLINGKGTFDCARAAAEGDSTPCNGNAGLSKFYFEHGKTHRLRLVNAGCEGLQRFSIDGHMMTVIANDFVPVEPYITGVVTLGIGQRTDVLVKAMGQTTPSSGDAFWMRSNISEACSLAKQPHGLAAVYYKGADDTRPPQSTPWHIPDPKTCANDDLAVSKPIMKLQLPPPDLTMTMDIRFFTNATGHKLWSLDGVDFRGNFNSPTLLLSHLGNLTFDKHWNAKNVGNAKSVRIILQNKSPVAHPIHLHGFNMYVLHDGLGGWDGTVVRPSNPQRRDVVQIRPQGHLVLQFDAGGNPGVWPFHCHIAWHSSAGFFSQFVVGPDALAAMKPPSVVAETCRQWAKWTETHIPDQIDSGL